jgi:hypothetical protein
VSYLTQPVGYRITDDGSDDEGDAAEEHPWIASGRKDVAADRTDNKSQTDSDGECDGEPCDIDGRDKEEIRDVENCASDEGEEDVMDVGCPYVSDELPAREAKTAKGEPPE